MIATTVISSSSVNPSCPVRRPTRLRITSPCRACRPGPCPRLSKYTSHTFCPHHDRLSGVVLVAAHSPLVGAGHGIDRDAPQELQLVVKAPDLAHALHQRLQVRRIALAAQLHVGAADPSLVHRLLVLVDRRAQRAQLPAQLDLLLPDAPDARHRQDGRGQDHQDARGRDHLEIREAAAAPLAARSSRGLRAAPGSRRRSTRPRSAPPPPPRCPACAAPISSRVRK